MTSKFYHFKLGAFFSGTQCRCTGALVSVVQSVSVAQHDTWLPLRQHIGPVQDTWLSTSDVKRGQNLEAEAKAKALRPRPELRGQGRGRDRATRQRPGL